MSVSAEPNKFSGKAKSWSVAFLTAAFMVSNVSAAEAGAKFIEPSSTDLSQPFTSTVCVKTTPGQPGLTAWDKLVTVMSARGQMIAAEGNQVVTGPNSRQVKLVTIANNFSGKEGYIISGDVPNANRTQSPEFCIKPTAFAVAVNQTDVPKVVNKGELGIGLTNHNAAGTKTAVVGMYPTGSLFAVIFNPSTHKGAIYTAENTGYKAAPIAALEDFDYSAKMKKVFEVASADKANGKPSIVAAGNPNFLLARAPE